VSGLGIDELVDAIDKHRTVAHESQIGRNRRLAIAQFRLRKTAENMLLQRFAADIASEGGTLAGRLMRRELDPYAVATEFLNPTTLREREETCHEPDARTKIA
jgi:GTPase